MKLSDEKKVKMMKIMVIKGLGCCLLQRFKQSFNNWTVNTLSMLKFFYSALFPKLYISATFGISYTKHSGAQRRKENQRTGTVI
jgi:hypothetical protein